MLQVWQFDTAMQQKYVVIHLLTQICIFLSNLLLVTFHHFHVYYYN